MPRPLRTRSCARSLNSLTAQAISDITYFDHDLFHSDPSGPGPALTFLGPDPAGILGLTVHTIAPPSNGGPPMYQNPSQLMQLMQLMQVFSRSGRLTEGLTPSFSFFV